MWYSFSASTEASAPVVLSSFLEKENLELHFRSFLCIDFANNTAMNFGIEITPIHVYFSIRETKCDCFLFPVLNHAQIPGRIFQLRSIIKNRPGNEARGESILFIMCSTIQSFTRYC